MADPATSFDYYQTKARDLVDFSAAWASADYLPARLIAFWAGISDNSVGEGGGKQGDSPACPY